MKFKMNNQMILPYNVKYDNLLKNGELFEPSSAIDYFYLGYYHLINNKDPVSMHYYFTLASEQGCKIANFYMGGYYHSSGYHKLGLAYYKEAVMYGDIVSMHDLGWLYYKNGKFEKMEKFYIMAIENECVRSMHDLGWLYYKNGKFEKMEKFYIMAIENQCVRSMNDLGWHYYEQKQFVKMKKYYLMACDNGFEMSFNNLVIYYDTYNKQFGLFKLYIKYHERFNNRKELIDIFNSISSQQLSAKRELKFLEIISNFTFNNDDNICSSLKLLNSTIKNKLDLIDLHFDYSVAGKGAIEAKKDFLERCI